jgi:hypothetical protein
MEAAAEARASTTPELLARQRRALKPTTGAPKTVVVTEASLRTFYEQHNPANTAPDRLKIVLQHYDGRHDALLRDLSKRYGAAASAALCAVGQQLYADDQENVAPPRAAVATVKDDKDNAPPPRRSKQLSHDADKENVPPSGKSPVKAARRRHTITSPYRPRAAPAPLRAPQRRSVDTCVPPEVEVPKTVKASSPPVTTPSVRHVPEVSPPKVWPPSINLADRLAQAVKARFFCDAHVAATVETVSVATSPITVPGAATFVPPRRRRLGVVAAAVAVAFVACAALGRAPPATKPAKAARPRRVAWPERVAPGACVHLTRRHLACAPPKPARPPPPPKLLLTEPKPKGVLAKRVRTVIRKAAKPTLVAVAIAPVGPVWAWRMGRLARAVPAVAQLSQAQAAAAYWFCGAAGFGVCALAGMMI